jgi:hypothetical protein
VLEPVPADAADGWAVATGEAFAELRAAPRGAGTAWLRVAAPGYAPESVSVRVTAARRLRFVDPVYRDVARTVIGARQSSGLEDAVLVDGADGGGPPYAVITLTQRHPERVRIAATLPVDLTSGRRTLRFAGLAVGVDTLVASAPGLLPDTLVVHVSTPRLIVRGRSGERTLPDSGRVTTPLAVSLFVGDSLGRAHFPLDGPVPLAATSSDAAVLRVGAAVTVGTSSGGSGDVWVRLLDVGTGTLTFSDPAGRLAPVTIPPRARRRHAPGGRGRDLAARGRARGHGGNGSAMATICSGSRRTAAASTPTCARAPAMPGCSPAWPFSPRCLTSPGGAPWT